MTGFSRRILRGAGVMLLGLSLVALGAWPWSFHRVNGVLFAFPWQGCVAVWRGSFAVVVYPRPRGMISGLKYKWIDEPATPERDIHTFAGFVWARDRNVTLGGVPLWLVAIAFGFGGLKLTRRKKEILPGFCVGCGYDMRATPERCPECGRLAGIP